MRAWLALAFTLMFGVSAIAADAEPPNRTVGPNGEDPTPYTDVVPTAAQIAKAKERKLKGVLLLHQTTDFTNALQSGVKDAFAKAGVTLAVVTDAEMDSNKQRTDIETSLALSPDILITLILDPVTGAVALRQAIDQGVKVALISNLPQGFAHGRDYAGIVTDDLFAMGSSVAEMMADRLDGRGKVALLYHDANYYVTNQRDQAVASVLKKKYPGIEIVVERGIANPADGETLAGAIMTQYPDVQAIYAPWDTIAEGVVAAARAIDRNDLMVFTMDIGANNGLDLAKGGNIAGIVADLPYALGEAVANVGILAALGERTPPFVVVPAIKIDKANLVEAWQESLNQRPPKEILTHPVFGVMES
ncbi:MAG: substrate-binding domain-containing protein [Planctomycetota bacterium]|nr:substrate-binding domain-containing protein [Planctomycetota bacterium]